MKYLFSFLCILIVITGCEGSSDGDFPVRPEQERLNRRGKLTGDGLTIFNGSDDGSSSGSGGASPIGVNSFLWRATLDTISFLPLASADPFGGVVITDWYVSPQTKEERYKLNILILDKTLRADALKVSVFKQQFDNITNSWVDSVTDTETARKIEDTILTRARELKIQQSR